MADEPNQNESTPSAEEPKAAPEASAEVKPAEAQPATQGDAKPLGQAEQHRGGGDRFGGPGQRQGGGGGRFGGPGQRQGGPGQRGRFGGNDKPDDGFTEKVICINRSAKVVKGGRRFGFSAVVVVGDKKGRVGMGQGKANQVADCIRKASENARTQLLNVCELAGVRNMLSKSLGSNNPVNVAKATLDGLLKLRDRNEVLKARGKTVAEPEPEAAAEPAAAAE